MGGLRACSAHRHPSSRDQLRGDNISALKLDNIPLLKLDNTFRLALPIMPHRKPGTFRLNIHSPHPPTSRPCAPPEPPTARPGPLIHMNHAVSPISPQSDRSMGPIRNPDNVVQGLACFQIVDAGTKEVGFKREHIGLRAG
jgi:hypothetical protein